MREETGPRGWFELPLAVVNNAWHHCMVPNGTVDPKAYTFCVLDRLHHALRRRDRFLAPSVRYADPRLRLLEGEVLASARPFICRTLGLPPPLVALCEAVKARLPHVDLPEILREIAAWTGFTEKFTHISEREARAAHLPISLCAVLMVEAYNIGLSPMVRSDVTALRWSRLVWVSQHYLWNDTLTEANARLVAAQNQIPLVHCWGGSEVAAAHGLCFVVPMRRVYAGPSPKDLRRGAQDDLRPFGLRSVHRFQCHRGAGHTL